MKISGIYKITSPSNRIYIGMSVDIESRKWYYEKLQCESQRKLYKSFLKYGFENHKFEIIEECSREFLPEREKYWVDFYQTFNTKHGLNIRDGGGNQAKLSDEQKGLISKTLTGQKHTPERIETNRRVNTGKKLSEEHKRKISENNGKSMLGKKHTEESKKKMSSSHRGKPTWMTGKTHSEETREKISDKVAGEKHPFYGKERSEETKQRIRESVKKNWELRKQQELLNNTEKENE